MVAYSYLLCTRGIVHSWGTWRFISITFVTYHKAPIGRWSGKLHPHSWHSHTLSPSNPQKIAQVKPDPPSMGRGASTSDYKPVVMKVCTENKLTFSIQVEHVAGTVHFIILILVFDSCDIHGEISIPTPCHLHPPPKILMSTIRPQTLTPGSTHECHWGGQLFVVEEQAIRKVSFKGIQEVRVRDDDHTVWALKSQHCPPCENTSRGFVQRCARRL